MPYQLNVESLDPQSFGVMDKAGRRTFPARFFPSAFGASDVRVEDFWTGEKMTIPLGSRVGGATPASQAALITALRNVVGQQSVIDATMARLFVDQYGNQLPGVWYDPSDLSTMFSDSGGSAAITTTGQTVALILDKRLGATPSTADQWVDASVVFGGESTRVDATTYRILSTAGVNSTAQVVGALVVGQVYRVTFTVVSSTGVGVRVGDTGAVASAAGVHVSTFVADSTIAFIKRNGNITDTVVTDISFRLIPGNHAYQATAASRPIFRDVAGLRYLEFDGVDDYLRSTFTIAQPIDRISALQQVTWTILDQILGGVTAAGAILFQSTVSPGVAINSGFTIALNSNLALGTTGITTERHWAANSRFAINDGIYGSANAGATLPGGITIGASNTLGAFANFNLYQLVMRGSTTAMTDAQVSACRALCAIKSGVTI